VEGRAVAEEQVKPVEQEVQETPTETPQRKGRGFLRVVKAVAFVSVIVVVQIVVASMLAPSTKDTERLAQELVGASSGKGAGHEENAEKSEAAEAGQEQDLHEVELGKYNVTRFNPATNTTLAIDFELYGTVLADDAAEFEHHFEKSNARIKEQITLTMHGADSTDLTDAGLGLIKRQILEKTNRALGQPLLKEVLFSKFNFVER
jgi:flagellar basal body-associated protein FliL